MGNLRLKIWTFILLSMPCINAFSIDIENEDGIVLRYTDYYDGSDNKYYGLTDIVSIPQHLLDAGNIVLNVPESIIINGQSIPVTKVQPNSNNLGSWYQISGIHFPNSINRIGGRFPKNIKTLIFEHIEVMYVSSYVFWDCHLENIIIKHFNHESTGGRQPFGSTYSSNVNYIFSENSYTHANLYVPIGCKEDFAYYTGKIIKWGSFVHLSELAMEISDISETSVYSLINTEDFSHLVYNQINNAVSSLESNYDLDESNSNNGWQIIKQGDKFYLYNLGAKQYVTVNSQGKLSLSSFPTELTLTTLNNGISIGNSVNVYAFVPNGKLNIDQSVTSIKNVQSKENNIDSYYSLDGKKSSTPRKGLNIIRSMSGSVKKIFSK